MTHEKNVFSGRNPFKSSLLVKKRAYIRVDKLKYFKKGEGLNCRTSIPSSTGNKESNLTIDKTNSLMGIISTIIKFGNSKNLIAPIP